MILFSSIALTPALVAANTTAEQSFVIPAVSPALAPGAVVVTVNKPTAQAGLGIVGSRLIDATHLGITFSNNTAGGFDANGGGNVCLLNQERVTE